MKIAINEAKKAALEDEVPIGAVIVKDGKVLCRAHNRKEHKLDATAHAEIEAIKKASKKLNNWYLEGCELYVTLEPCPMCAGAIINARLDAVYFGAWDTKAGCCGTLYNILEDMRFNHNPTVKGGIMREESARLLSDFFKNKRKNKNEAEG